MRTWSSAHERSNSRQAGVEGVATVLEGRNYQVRAPWQVCMGGARDLPQYQVIPRPGRRRNSPAWLLLERTRQDWINCKMKQKTSLQI